MCVRGHVSLKINQTFSNERLHLSLSCNKCARVFDVVQDGFMFKQVLTRKWRRGGVNPNLTLPLFFPLTISHQLPRLLPFNRHTSEEALPSFCALLCSWTAVGNVKCWGFKKALSFSSKGETLGHDCSIMLFRCSQEPAFVIKVEAPVRN